MTRLRLVLITRRFWPLVGGAEMTMANLADALVSDGHQVTILTAAWNKDWPAEIRHRGVRVQRIPQANSRWLGTWQYMRGIKRWLKEHQDEFDLVYVSMLKHDAYVAVRAGANGRFPVVLRAEGSGPTGDIAWQEQNWCGRWIRNRCRRASAIVAPNSTIKQELLQAGYDRNRVQQISNGVALGPERSSKGRMLAREALGTAHAVLSLGLDTALVVYTGRLSEEKGLMGLVEAWALVLKRRGNCRLWLVGEGPLRDALAEQIERLKIRGRCVLVGSFDSVEELLAAADLFVLPSQHEGMSIALLEAMASGLPLVASDIPGNRTLIESGETGVLISVDNPPALAEAIENLLASPERGKQLGIAARKRVQQHFTLKFMVDRLVALFSELLSETRGS
jgi:glycosyltransferase involved in cell wall biosynthesis